MKHITFFLLLAYSLATQAQCDPAAYQEILTKAKDYQAKGDYIMAKNNYQAAIIFHCKPEEKEACEKAIDNLFESNAELLQKIKAANTSLLPPLIQLFEGFIYEMNYDAAQDILEKSVEIDRQLNYAGRDSFTNEYLHLIYHHYEFGKQNQNKLHKQHISKAIQLCKAMCLYRKEKDKSYISGDSLSYIRTTLADMLNSDLKQKLHHRYYPNMITVKGATFDMRHGEKGSHQVSLSDYEIGQTEVTVQQYFLFCEASGYDKPKNTPSWGWKADNPIVYVNWADAAAYCNWLTERENADKAEKNKPIYSIAGKQEWTRQTGKDSAYSIVTKWGNSKAYHLPSEAQWQFAAEGGALVVSAPLNDVSTPLNDQHFG